MSWEVPTLDNGAADSYGKSLDERPTINEKELNPLLDSEIIETAANSCGMGFTFTL